jgi:hypothetical protein
MRPTSENRSPTTRKFPAVSATGRAYSELLKAHESASTRGKPLLTETGVSYVRQQLLRPRGSPGEDKPPTLTASQAVGLPYWDAENRRLWLGGVLIKEYLQPAPNQTRLLDVFQEQGWENTHIDDPISSAPAESEEDVKRRLHDTIKNLNRGLLPGTIRFSGDGTGQGVRWHYDGRRAPNLRRPSP